MVRERTAGARPEKELAAPKLADGTLLAALPKLGELRCGSYGDA